MAYRAADNPDRMKALGGVIVVHAALAAIILSGLNVHNAAQNVEQLKTFDIREVPPPPPPPPPSPKAERAKDKEGAAAKKALPTPVVAPPPRIVLPYQPPITAARVASTGGAATAGAATAGSGTGAGGSGNGLGGGGQGLGSAPRLLFGGPSRGDYRRLGARINAPTKALVRLSLSADGDLIDCVVVTTSGYPDVDARICPLLMSRMKWAPARDKTGRAVPSWLNFWITFARI